jgi:hypothetical protein
LQLNFQQIKIDNFQILSFLSKNYFFIS